MEHTSEVKPDPDTNIHRQASNSLSSSSSSSLSSSPLQTPKPSIKQSNSLAVNSLLNESSSKRAKFSDNTEIESNVNSSAFTHANQGFEPTTNTFTTLGASHPTKLPTYRDFYQTQSYTVPHQYPNPYTNQTSDFSNTQYMNPYAHLGKNLEEQIDINSFIKFVLPNSYLIFRERKV